MVERVKDSLVGLSGVMSITFQLGKKRVVVRACASLDECAVVQAISKVSSDLVAVSRSNNGRRALMNSSILSRSGYLPEPTASDERQAPGIVDVHLSGTRFGSLISRFSQAVTNYLW